MGSIIQDSTPQTCSILQIHSTVQTKCHQDNLTTTVKAVLNEVVGSKLHPLTLSSTVKGVLATTLAPINTIVKEDTQCPKIHPTQVSRPCIPGPPSQKHGLILGAIATTLPQAPSSNGSLATRRIKVLTETMSGLPILHHGKDLPHPHMNITRNISLLHSTDHNLWDPSLDPVRQIRSKASQQSSAPLHRSTRQVAVEKFKSPNLLKQSRLLLQAQPLVLVLVLLFLLTHHQTWGGPLLGPS